MTATVQVNLEGGPQYYQHAGWQDDAARKWHIKHGFFTANGGVSTGLYQSLNCGFGSNDDPALIAENRRRVANSLGFQPDQMFGLRQTHSANVVKIDTTSDASINARADGFRQSVPDHHSIQNRNSNFDKDPCLPRHWR